MTFEYKLGLQLTVMIELYTTDIDIHKYRHVSINIGTDSTVNMSHIDTNVTSAKLKTLKSIVWMKIYAKILVTISMC